MYIKLVPKNRSSRRQEALTGFISRLGHADQSLLTSAATKNKGGWTLTEILVATGVFSIGGLAIATLFIFSARSLASLANYAILDKANRQTMDRLTSEIRQAVQVSSVTTNPATLTLLNGDNQTVTYTFEPNKRELVRGVSDGSRQVLLTNCTLLNFNIYQRNPSNGNYGVFHIATTNWVKEAKLIELTWKTSITVSPTANVNSENVQTARIVIRKQRN
jgi:Tfp pilus assembly protein PilV